MVPMFPPETKVSESQKKGKYILNHETTEKDIEQSTIAPVVVSIGKYTRTVSKKSSSDEFRFLYGSYVPTRNESS